MEWYTTNLKQPFVEEMWVTVGLIMFSRSSRKASVPGHQTSSTIGISYSWWDKIKFRISERELCYESLFITNRLQYIRIPNLIR